MKRTGAILVVTGLAFFLAIPASVAAAKGYKAPKSSCWRLNGTGLPLDTHRLAIAVKPSGMKLVDANGKVKLYRIQGGMAPVAVGAYDVAGAGHWDATSAQFEGNIDGFVAGEFITCNIILSETLKQAFCAVAPNLVGSDSYALSELDCETLSLD